MREPKDAQSEPQDSQSEPQDPQIEHQLPVTLTRPQSDRCSGPQREPQDSQSELQAGFPDPYAYALERNRAQLL